MSSMGKAGKQLLRRRVQETYGGGSTPQIDELINSLRARYPEYCRQKPQRFTRLVTQALDSQNNKNKRKLSTDDDMTSSSSRRRIELQSESSFSEVYSHQLVSPEKPNNMELELVTVMTFSNEEEDEVDLTKSMLRNKYKSVELELVTETKKVDLVMEDETVKVESRALKSNYSLFDDDNNEEEEEEDEDDDDPWFKDLGGLEAVLDELKKKLIAPLRNPRLPRRLRLRLMTGILLHGPPGCGKTKLALAIANEAGLPFYEIKATELVSGVSGASEENIRELFSKAYKTAPSIIFIDEIDAIASSRENLQREMERRIVTQLMSCMDTRKQGYVLVIGATNRPDALDPALRRPGRFDREFALGVPDENARIKILSVLTRNIQLESSFDLVKVARLTPGFVGADLKALVREAGYLAMGRCFDRKSELSTDNEGWWRKEYSWSPEELENCRYIMSDFEAAAKLVQPSLKRKGFSSIPDVKWEDIGGLDLLRKEFYDYLVKFIKYPVKDQASPQNGFLLFGPPGCGKTSIAKAVANESGANFIHIRGAEIMSKYVGDSELEMRTKFSRARACAPCILFFDEIDALAPKRGTEGSWVTNRLVNQLLIELDGGDERKGVYVIAATNRIDVMDGALLRPGRFGKRMYVPLPNQEQRGLILKALSRNKQLGADVDLMAIARSEACANFSGDDLKNLLKEAEMAAKIEADRTSVSSSQSYADGMPLIIEAIHFEQAFRKVRASVSDKERQYHDLLAKSYGAFD